VTNAGGTYIGWTSATSDAYTLSGGVLNATTTGGETWLTQAAGNTAVLNVSGTGVLNHSAGRFIVGTYGTGTVNQTGGTQCRQKLVPSCCRN
jgi:hypothetical protein